jgi:predicted nucleic acid-binding protein
MLRDTLILSDLRLPDCLSDFTKISLKLVAFPTAGFQFNDTGVLWYGVAKSSQVQENTERLRVLLSGDVDLLDFDDEDARAAGQVRATLEKAGTPIGAYDLLIAGQALRRELTVVTANTSAFSRVAGLSWQDWRT